MYYFTFSYDNDPYSIIYLPLAPENFKTKVNSFNKTFEMINGEVNILKDLKLRDFSFKVLLPKDNALVDNKSLYKEPIFYLSKFREYVDNKKPLRFIIIRKLDDNAELFEGNLLVSLESYDVEEKAGENGDFWVSLNLKEYKNITANVILAKKNNSGQVSLSQKIHREVKEPSKTYTVKTGDTLWKIASVELGDGSKWSVIAKLNNITGNKNLKIGQVLKLV